MTRAFGSGRSSAARRPESQVLLAELVRCLVPQYGSEYGDHEACAEGGNRSAVDCIHQKVPSRNGGTGKPPLACSTRCAFTPHQLLGGLLLRRRSALPPIDTTDPPQRKRRLNRVTPNQEWFAFEAPDGERAIKRFSKRNCLCNARRSCVFRDKSLDKGPGEPINSALQLNR